MKSEYNPDAVSCGNGVLTRAGIHDSSGSVRCFWPRGADQVLALSLSGPAGLIDEPLSEPNLQDACRVAYEQYPGPGDPH